MENVVGVTFSGGKRVYYFNPNNLEFKLNDKVIVETERGLQFGTISTNILEKKKESLNLPLKRVLRLESKDDIKKNKSNLENAKKAMIECEKLIKKHNLSMKLIDASFTFD